MLVHIHAVEMTNEWSRFRLLHVYSFIQCDHVYLADAGCQAGVLVDASLHAAVAALAVREAHVTHGTPGHIERELFW